MLYTFGLLNLLPRSKHQIQSSVTAMRSLLKLAMLFLLMFDEIALTE
jgi:hypothetical protein